jgi:hypothetical protein
MRDHNHHKTIVWDDEIDELFGKANPNPGRIGCPSREVLLALARKARPIEDPAYQHLTECSACYVDVRVIQRSMGSPANAFGAVARRMMIAAAVVLVAGGATWFVAVARDGRIERDDASLHGNVIRDITLDVRNDSPERGERNSPAPQPIRLPRDRLRVTILLPVGSEAGTYELELVAADRQSRTSATGVATIREFITTLETEVDLRGLRSGPYQLGLRRQDEDWRFFSTLLR